MKSYKTILIIGIIEILIGSVTLLSNFLFIALSLNTKSPNVLFFVIVAGCVSTLIGVGILRFNKLAYQLLLYFSSVVILSKILIFMNIIQFNGELEVSVHQVINKPAPDAFKQFMINLKNIISVAYHAWIIYFFQKQELKEIFMPQK